MRLHRLRRVPPSGDSGFSLVEAVVALAIATTIFTALAFALVGAAKSALLSQQNQQAGDVLNQAVEQARALTFQSLTMRPADLDVNEATDGTRTPPLSAGFYNPANDTTTGGEPLVVPDPNGKIDVHVTQEVQNNGTFTVRRYVTVPADASGAVYKRLTVIVEWNSLGRKRSRVYSTLIADSRRGLPLPDFKYTGASSLGQCRNPGSQAVYAFNLRNNGARDSWRLTSAPTGPAWQFHTDTNGNGVFDTGVDALMAGSPTAPATGLLEPTTGSAFFAVLGLDTAAVQPPPYTLTTVFRATSAAQPSYWQEQTAVTTVQAAACGATVSSPSPSPSAAAGPPPAAPAQPAPSCTSVTGPAVTQAPGGTMIRYYPYNPDQPGSTTGRVGMPLQRDNNFPPAVGNLYNYSTELHAAAGRYLGSGVGSSPSQVASWTYQMPATSVLKGKGEATFWATPVDPTATPHFSIKLEVLAADGTTTVQSFPSVALVPSGAWACAGMRPFSVQLVDVGGSGATVLANQRLRLSARVTNGVPVRLGYGTASYPATLTLPYSNGLG